MVAANLNASGSVILVLARMLSRSFLNVATSEASSASFLIRLMQTLLGLQFGHARAPAGLRPSSTMSLGRSAAAAIFSKLVMTVRLAVVAVTAGFRSMTKLCDWPSRTIGCWPFFLVVLADLAVVVGDFFGGRTWSTPRR